MKTLHVYIVRHAESANNALGCHDTRVDDSDTSCRSREENTQKAVRNPDPALTERGIAQAAAAAGFFQRLQADSTTEPELCPCRLVVSGFKRALATCRPIAEALLLHPEVNTKLGEEGGIFEGPRKGRSGVDWKTLHGLNAEQMGQLLPGVQVASDLPAEGWWPGGVETSEEASQRAHECTEWLWQLAEQHTEGQGAVMCVSHGLFMDRWLKSIIGLPPTTDTCGMLTANCAYWLVALRLNPSGDGTAAPTRQAMLKACNVVDHVPPAIRTGHKLMGHSHCQASYCD